MLRCLDNFGWSIACYFRRCIDCSFWKVITGYFGRCVTGYFAGVDFRSLRRYAADIDAFITGSICLCLLFHTLPISNFLFPFVPALDCQLEIYIVNCPGEGRLHFEVQLEDLHQTHFIIVPKLCTSRPDVNLGSEFVFVVFVNAHSPRNVLLRLFLAAKYDVIWIDVANSTTNYLAKLHMVCRCPAHYIFKQQRNTKTLTFNTQFHHNTNDQS